MSCHDMSYPLSISLSGCPSFPSNVSPSPSSTSSSAPSSVSSGGGVTELLIITPIRAF